jgi:protein SCO1
MGFFRDSARPRAGLALLFLVAVWVAAWAASLAATGCARGRAYELRGQVLAVDEARQELTVRHEDIEGFMPGMTMPFRVRTAKLLRDRKPGELIRATLVVAENDVYLSAIESTGHAPLVATPPPPRVDLLTPGDTIADADFVDERGSRRRLAAWRGQMIALTFIYTRCPVPTFCPLMDRRFAEVQRLVVGDTALRGRVHLVSISFDPAFDTPAVLAAHAKQAGADPAVWSFLTGERSEIEAFGAPLGVSILPPGDSPREIVHNLRTVVVDTDGRLVRIFSGSEWSAVELVNELRHSGDGR